VIEPGVAVDRHLVADLSLNGARRLHADTLTEFFGEFGRAVLAEDVPLALHGPIATELERRGAIELIGAPPPPSAGRDMDDST
jgi:hypothetical protein